MPSPWAPDEPASVIYSEDTYLQGTFLMCIAYGAVVTLSIQCFFLLIRKLKRATLLKDGPLLLFVIVIFALSTITTPIGMWVSMNIYINDRNYPGGPSVYLVVSFSDPVNSVANACIVTSAFVSDALLVSVDRTYHEEREGSGFLSCGVAPLSTGIAGLINMPTLSTLGLLLSAGLQSSVSVDN